MNRIIPELPLLRRELFGILRTRRAFWLLVLGVAAASIAPLLRWPTGGSPAAGALGSANAVAAFFLSQLCAILILVPIFTAGAIAGERERNTWDMLVAAPISERSIVLSKALAAAGCVLIFVVACAPVFFLLYFLGGVQFVIICTLASAGCFLLVTAIAGTSVVREREQGNLDFLCGTLLSSQEIILGKFFSALHGCAGLLLAALVAGGICFGSKMLSPIPTRGIPVTVFLPFPLVAFAAALITSSCWAAAASLLASTVSRWSLQAMLLAYGLSLAPVLLYIIPGFAARDAEQVIVHSICLGFGALLALALAGFCFDKLRMRAR